MRLASLPTGTPVQSTPTQRRQENQCLLGRAPKTWIQVKRPRARRAGKATRLMALRRRGSAGVAPKGALQRAILYLCGLTFRRPQTDRLFNRVLRAAV